MSAEKTWTDAAMRMHSSLPKIASRAKALLATLAMTGTSAVIAAEGAGKGGFSEKASLGELVEFQFTGLLVVFVVLGSLTVLSYLIGWLLKRIAPDQYHGKAKASHTSAPVAKAPAPAPVPAPKPAPAATPPRCTRNDPSGTDRRAVDGHPGRRRDGSPGPGRRRRQLPAARQHGLDLVDPGSRSTPHITRALSHRSASI